MPRSTRKRRRNSSTSSNKKNNLIHNEEEKETDKTSELPQLSSEESKAVDAAKNYFLQGMRDSSLIFKGHGNIKHTGVPACLAAAERLALVSKIRDEYSQLPSTELYADDDNDDDTSNTSITTTISFSKTLSDVKIKAKKNVTLADTKQKEETNQNNLALVLAQSSSTTPPTTSATTKNAANNKLVQYKRRIGTSSVEKETSKAVALRRKAVRFDPPEYHPPWELMRVISGHLGWVRAIAVDPSNDFFVTGSADRTIKVFDLASGTLKLTLTGHTHTVRGLALSARHPYMYSCGEDKQVFCWDLEYNKVIRKYHGHLSGVYCLSLHPTVDVLMTGGRDASCRVWDARSKHCAHILTGHSNTVCAVKAQASDPQVCLLFVLMYTYNYSFNVCMYS